MGALKRRLREVILSKQFLLNIVNRLFLRNKIWVKKKGNNVCDVKCILHNSKINIIGSNNKVIIEKTLSSNKIDIVILGNGNLIYIGNDVLCRDTKLWIEDNNNNISVGKETVFAGNIQLSAIEGTKIEIGEKCLFSDDIDIRTGDGHSILDNNGDRTNASKDIVIGDHVWCGRCVSILKSANIPSECVIATKSVVTKEYQERNVVLAGSPAKVVKKQIGWDYERR